MGSHNGRSYAGAGSYAIRPVHAHVLVVGWLSLFSWSVYYKAFKPKNSFLAKWHVWSAIIGSIGLTVGMWLHMVKPFPINEVVTLIFYIVGGIVLMLSFILFLILAIIQDDSKEA